MNKVGEGRSQRGKGLNAETNDLSAGIKGGDFGGYHFGAMGLNINADDKCENAG